VGRLEQQLIYSWCIVDVHIRRLRDKLGEHAWMIETVRGRGNRFRARK
jgi:DNA-binding response OmpR family regulator